jgi:hypothetical protein
MENEGIKPHNPQKKASIRGKKVTRLSIKDKDGTIRKTGPVHIITESIGENNFRITKNSIWLFIQPKEE